MNEKTSPMNSDPNGISERMHQELLDALDEELELELEDSPRSGVPAEETNFGDDQDTRRKYFRELLRLQAEQLAEVLAAGVLVVAEVRLLGRHAASRAVFQFQLQLFVERVQQLLVHPFGNAVRVGVHRRCLLVHASVL